MKKNTRKRTGNDRQTRPRRRADARKRPRRPGRRHLDALVAADREIDSVRHELQQAASRLGPPRWNARPEDVQRSVMQLVLTLVEFIRRLLERQAIRRLEGHTLTKKQTENVGLALMRLEKTIHDLARQFDLDPEDLNLELGPVGRLM